MSKKSSSKKSSSKKSSSKKYYARGEILDKKITGITNKWIINKDKLGNYRYYRMVVIRQRVHPATVPTLIKRRLQSMILQKQLDKKRLNKTKSSKRSLSKRKSSKRSLSKRKSSKRSLSKRKSSKRKSSKRKSTKRK
jgi:hypothetical protein